MTTRTTTEDWARACGISAEPSAPAVDHYEVEYPRSAVDVATRAVILMGVVAAAADVPPGPIVEWYREQGVWADVTPRERVLLQDPASATREEISTFRWRQEAMWVLLWLVRKVGHLGLPTRECDTRRLVDEIMPALGSDISLFVRSAALRTPGEILAEDDRHYNMWCRWFQTRREDPARLPRDLNYDVLYQRRYAFEWIDGMEAWDDVQCDA
jgi:hypothetical protein